MMKVKAIISCHFVDNLFPFFFDKVFQTDSFMLISEFPLFIENYLKIPLLFDHPQCQLITPNTATDTATTPIITLHFQIESQCNFWIPLRIILRRSSFFVLLVIRVQFTSEIRTQSKLFIIMFIPYQFRKRLTGYWDLVPFDL